MQTALGLLKAGRVAEARAVLAPLALAQPRLAPARYLLGLALQRLGDQAAAIEALRAAVSLDKRQPLHFLALGDVLAASGDTAGAETALRAALALNRRFVDAALSLVELLLSQGRAAEALQVMTPLAAAPQADEAVLGAQGRCLAAVGREEEAVTAHTRACAVAPASAVAEHNLAAVCGDMLRFAEAEAAARRALAKGADMPATWLVLARAVQGQGRLDEAEAIYSQTLRRTPADLNTVRAFAQLRWMRSGDLEAALAPVRAALAAAPDHPALHLLDSSLRTQAGDEAGAYAAAAAAAARPGASTGMHLAAGRAALPLDPVRALAHVRAAEAMTPGEVSVRMALCVTHLALGEPDVAESLAAALRQERPNDQHVLACLATAWRLLGDPRYRDLYDYAAFVRPWRLDPPTGWSSLGDYLAELKAALLRIHPFVAPPLNQSVRGGGQTNQDLQTCAEPAVRAFFEAIDAPIRAHIAALGQGKDPLRSRNLGGYGVAGAWSVRLRPSVGRHVDHVHQDGWLSSAFYVDVPSAAANDDRQGWLRFGQPGIPTRPALEPEHAVRPEPGRLVLFPSYMWHGVTPFGGDAERLTLALDIVPARPSRRR